MSDFEYEQPGSVEPAEPAPQEPVAPPPEGSPSPSDVTRAYAAEARRLESGEPSPAVTESHPVEPPATVEQPTAEDQLQALNEWLEAEVEAKAQAKALEFVEQELGDIAPFVDEETLAELVALMPPEIQESLARRAEQIEEEQLLREIELADAHVDQTNALRQEGSRKLDALIAGWQREEPGAPDVDPEKVFEAVVEQWPDVALRIGESPEIAEGLLRQAWESIANEQRGEVRAFGMIEAEAAKLGVELDPLRTKALADELFPEVAKRISDPAEAAHAAIAAAAALQTNFRPAQNAKSITRYYSDRARQIRAASGQVDGEPPARMPVGSLPNLVTARYAAEAAAIRRRSGQL